MNKFEGGFAYRTNSIWSIQASFHVNDSFSIGYAYDTYLENQLSGLNLKAHELVVRFKFGEAFPPEQQDVKSVAE